ncbi:membrane-targeted effector domain-containing toxin [Pseudomonas sp.]|uniref:membrane-targeted effector domain-containing toxin n=1 Tax=Pseudomonas sp. TaxID=306 RepID=UPI002604E9DC|nr:membrane-targeted effector domain-containing toxin [Pseudomonas sp.]
MHSFKPFQQSTGASPDEAALKIMGQRLVEACPDMLEMARDAAKEILRKRTGADLEPDHVYWHRFSTSVSSPRTFSGWQHYDPPIESLTLPQLVMRRFNAHDQDNALDLQVIGGFYTAGPSAKVFNETNEVRLLPAEVLSDLWEIDFSSRYAAKRQSFWQDYADDFRTMAKANFIARALEERDGGRLTAKNFNTVISAVCGDVSGPISLEMLRSEAPGANNLRVCVLDIDGIAASNIVRIIDQHGRQIVYVPGDIDAFHVFETPDDLQWWIMSQTNRAQNRAAFMAHFPLSSHVQDNSSIGLNNMIDLLFSQWGAPGPGILNQSDQPIAGDAFTWMRDAAKDRMMADAYFSVHSNSDLRKQLWIGFLNNFSRIAGGVAALDWPVALVAVGAGLTNTGLNIDQAVNGHTTAERKAGVIGAILSSVDALFNSLFLIGAGGASAEGEATLEVIVPEEGINPIEPIEHTSLVAELESLAPGPVYPVQSDALLAPFETNVLLDSYTPLNKGRMRGIYILENGETYISMDDFAYAVRYSNEIKSWVMIDPSNPFSFYRNLPVRLNATGEWEPVLANGLKGGGKILGKLPWGRAATIAPEVEPVINPYDVVELEKADLRAAAEGASQNVLSGQNVSLAPGWRDPYVRFRATRLRLSADADAFYAKLELPPRPEMPVLEATTKGKTLFKKMFEKSSGLVIGENHSSIGSKQILIENMPQLAKLKVKTLYMEHLLTDFHQADLDLFARTGKMPKGLKRYIDSLDGGHRTDPSGRYTFLALIKTANENHIRIQAIDCMASYRLAGMPDPSETLRQKMMNFFSSSVIRADQAARGPSRWVALVGNSHANTFKGVPGVSELDGAIGLKIEDVPKGQSKGVEVDPGRDMIDNLGRDAGRVQSDFRLQMETRPAEVAPDTSDERLVRVGMFTIDNTAEPVLIHRSGENVLVRTPIKSDGGHFYIERPKWPYISGRRFDSIRELVSALMLMGMEWVD